MIQGFNTCLTCLSNESMTASVHPDAVLRSTCRTCRLFCTSIMDYVDIIYICGIIILSSLDNLANMEVPI